MTEPSPQGSDQLSLSHEPQDASQPLLGEPCASASSEPQDAAMSVGNTSVSVIEAHHELPSPTEEAARTLSWMALTGIVYFSVGGGPFGFEASLTASYPAMCMWTLLLIALLWALPQAMCIAEMSTQHTKGYNEWVTFALGPFVGFAHCWLRVAFNSLTSAIYCALFMNYFEDLVDLTKYTRVGVLCLFEAIVVSVNFIGLRIVGKASVGLLLLVLSPFVVMFCIAIPKLDPAILVDFSQGFKNVDGPVLISVIQFNLTGWDFMGNISSSARKPMRDIPVALSLALVLVLLTYLVPLIVAVSVVAPEDYGDNLFAAAAENLWWPLVYAVDGAAFLGLLGLGIAFMSTSSEAIALSSEWGYMPQVICKRFTSGQVPWIIIGIQGAIAVLLCIPWEYDTVVQIQMWLFSFSTVLIMLSFVVMRWKARKLPRNSKDFRLPLNFPAAILWVLPAVGLCCFAMVMADWIMILIGLIVVVTSVTAACFWMLIRKGYHRKLPCWKSSQYTALFGTKESDMLINSDAPDYEAVSQTNEVPQGDPSNCAPLPSDVPSSPPVLTT